MYEVGLDTKGIYEGYCAYVQYVWVNRSCISQLYDSPLYYYDTVYQT